MKRVDCDWCGAPMDRIGAVETGFLKGHASVWLCMRDGCGHESEVIDSLIGFVNNGRARLLIRVRDRWRGKLLTLFRGRVGDGSERESTVSEATTETPSVGGDGVHVR